MAVEMGLETEESLVGAVVAAVAAAVTDLASKARAAAEETDLETKVGLRRVFWEAGASVAGTEAATQMVAAEPGTLVAAVDLPEAGAAGPG